MIGFQNTSKRTRKYSSDPSERARELVRDGVIGGARPGAGRPRKSASDSQQRASSVVADAATQNADRIAATFIDTINDPDASRRAQMHASKTLIAIEAKEGERQRADDREGIARASDLPEDRDELAAALAAKLAANPILARRLGALLAAAASPGDDPPNIG